MYNVLLYYTVYRIIYTLYTIPYTSTSKHTQEPTHGK